MAYPLYMIRHNIPCPSPAKRPFQFVESLTTEDIAVDLVQKLDLHRISLQDILRYLFTSSHPEVLAKANSFYNHDGAAVMVKIWAKGVGRNKERLFVKAATEVVVSSGAVELDRLSKISHLRHPANAIDLDKIEDFDLEYIGQQLRESAPTVLDVITGLATVNPKKESSSTIVMICSILLFLCSQKSNHFQVMMGLYLYSCGCSSAIIDVLSKASVSVSLSSIQGALKGMNSVALYNIIRGSTIRMFVALTCH